MKCSKCHCEVVAQPDTIDLAVNTCEFKRLDEGCALKQMWDFLVRGEQKKAGLPKPLPQVPALLKGPNPEPERKTPDWLYPQDHIKKLEKLEQCTYCGKDEESFKKANGCPCFIHDCPLDQRLSALGRNPCPHEKSKREIVVCEACHGAGSRNGNLCKKCNGFGRAMPHEYADNSSLPDRFLWSGPPSQQPCPQCGKWKFKADKPCDVNCHWAPKETNKVVSTPATEFEFIVPDIMVISITKKGKMHVEMRNE